MMSLEPVRSPVQFLTRVLGQVPHECILHEYEAWWEEEGKTISSAIDRAGTPWLRMFDRFGSRVDEILYPAEYRKMLKKGYQTGVVWRALEEKSLLSSYLLGYLTSFYDVGLYCPYAVSLSTVLPLDKYGNAAVKGAYLPQLLRRDSDVWQGATWMTEAKGGSDLG